MSLRLLQIVLPRSEDKKLLDLLHDYQILGQTILKRGEEEYSSHQLIISSGASEKLIDELESNFAERDELQVSLLPLEATYPRESETKNKQQEKADFSLLFSYRRGREELLQNVEQDAQFSVYYVFMLVASAVVAALGLSRNDTALIIGSMVIAPLLGPSVGLALASALGDVKLGRNSLLTLFSGILILMTLGALMVNVHELHLDSEAILQRTQVQNSDIALGIAAGAAGCFAYLNGSAGALVGVTVAAALVPPLVAAGMFVGAGQYGNAIAAMLLAVIYLFAINLAGVSLFLLHGIRPRTWWKAEKASYFSKVAIVWWILLLAASAFLVRLLNN